MLIPNGYQEVCRWEILLCENQNGIIRYYSIQELPGSFPSSQQVRADSAEPDELAAMYDDVLRDVNLCRNLFELVIEDVTKVQSKLVD